MKRIRAALMAGMMLTSGQYAQAADVTITVNGSVVAQPCTVSTTSATVDFGNLYTFDFTTANSVSSWQTVNLDLTNCPVGTSKVTATFSGTADSTGSYYANSGAATNVAVQLEDTSGTNLPVGSTKTVQVDDSTLSASFPLQVRVISVAGGPGAGSIQSVINVTYTYA